MYFIEMWLLLHYTSVTPITDKEKSERSFAHLGYRYWYSLFFKLLLEFGFSFEFGLLMLEFGLSLGWG